jgi:hypothetical protein
METGFPAIHQWRSPTDHVVTGIEGLQSLRASVFVQPFTHEVLRQLYQRPVGTAAADGSPSAGAPLDDLYFGDAAGLVLLSQLQAESAIVTTYPTTLKAIDKRGNLVFAEFESTLRDVTIDGELQPEYYWTRRLVIITTPSHVYLVKASDSSKDHRSFDAAFLNGWFAAFRVLA